MSTVIKNLEKSTRSRKIFNKREPSTKCDLARGGVRYSNTHNQSRGFTYAVVINHLSVIVSVTENLAHSGPSQLKASPESARPAGSLG